jgi:hypothetical protein
MSTTVESRTELKRLQLALATLSEDFDAMESSPHLSLRIAAENLEPDKSYRLNTFVDQFAVAMKRSSSPDTGSESEHQLIDTAPRDGRFVILGEDASGKYDIARWAPEVAGWIREDGEPMKITPSYWCSIEAENYVHPELDILTSPAQPGPSEFLGTAAKRRFADDIVTSHSDGVPSGAVAAVKTGVTAAGLKGSSHARNRFAAVSIAASLVVAACIGMYFRTEVASYVAPRAVLQDFLEISAIGGQVVGQASQWLHRNLGSKVSAQISQRKNTQQVEASAMHIAAFQLQAEADRMGAKASDPTPTNAAIRLEPVAIPGKYVEAPGEHDRVPTLANESGMARGDFGTNVVLSSKTADEIARRTVEATAAELRQSLLEERDRVAVLALELAATRHDLEAEVALSSKAGAEVEQLRQAAKAATADVEQERNRSAELARELESAQRRIGAHSTIERSPSSQIDPMKRVVEAVAEPPRTAEKGGPEAARLMARASALLAQGSIGAARIVLDRAAETGSAEANFMLAESYDPIVLSKWGTHGTRGEATTARELYTKAYAGGIREAKDRLDALRQ